MKKTLLLTSMAIVMLTGASANAAHVDLGINLGVPVYAAPAPVYAPPVYPAYPAYPNYYYPGYVAPPPAVIVNPGVYYDPRHRARDWRYWQERRRWEHEHYHR